MDLGLGLPIPKPKGRRLAISDIHGCPSTFTALLNSIRLTANDQLFLLGDYVNKGPDSIGALDILMSVRSSDNVFALIGNHDKMILDYWNNPDRGLEEKLISLNAEELVTLPESSRKKYKALLSSLDWLYVLDDYLLVHAGFNFAIEGCFADEVSMLNIKGFSYHKEKALGKSIIHGHFPHPLVSIRKAIQENQPVIPIDNGCVYAGIRYDQGNLICLNIDTKEVILQPNID